MIPVQYLLTISCALFSIGIYGMLTRRNAIGLLLSLELILNAAVLNFVIFGRLFSHTHAHAFALFIIALAACEAVVGLAIIVNLYRHRKTVFTDQLQMLKG